MASGFSPFAMSDFFSDVQEVNLLEQKIPLLLIAFSPLLLCVTRYLSSSHVRLVFSLKYPPSWLKVDAKWVYGTESSRRCRSFTKKDNEKINMVTHIVTIPL